SIPPGDQHRVVLQVNVDHGIVFHRSLYSPGRCLGRPRHLPSRSLCAHHPFAVLPLRYVIAQSNISISYALASCHHTARHAISHGWGTDRAPRSRDQRHLTRWLDRHAVEIAALNADLVRSLVSAELLCKDPVLLAYRIAHQ